jgi:Rad3-related DNA helicase
VKAAAAAYPNSCAIFYPSYDYLFQISRMLHLPNFHHEIEVRGEGQDAANARKERLEKFADSKKPFILHAVVGGSYQEGIDFRKNPFKLIVMAGFPLPKPTASHKAYERYLMEKFESKAKAAQYASLLPAAIKTAQAIGRGIRANDDWCFALLIDDRFKEHLGLLPKKVAARAKILPKHELESEIAGFCRRMQKAGDQDG